MFSEEAKSLPVITEAPVIKAETWDKLRIEMEQGGYQYFWSLGAKMVANNPQHRLAYEEALRSDPPETPDATRAMVLLVLRVLDMQAKNDGYRLPEIPSPINPRPALRYHMAISNNISELIDIAYADILRTNPVIGSIVDFMAKGAPDELLQIATERQGKVGSVYAYFGVKSQLVASS